MTYSDRLDDALKIIYYESIHSISLDNTKTLLTITFGLVVEHSRVVLHAVGDCCSSSWIEHISYSPDVLGSHITSITHDELAPIEPNEDTLIQVYQTHLHTPKGAITLEYRNESNGYYGGWLELVEYRKEYA